MKWRDWVFANRHRGEVVARINGKRRRMRLSLSALAHLESCYGETDILTLMERFNRHGLSVQDAENILRAGLQATGDALAKTGAPLDVEGGAACARTHADCLLSRAFQTDPAKPKPDSDTANGI